MSALSSLVVLLFAPSNWPDRFARAAGAGADAVILDLEDAVPSEAKNAVRASLAGAALGLPMIVRIPGMIRIST